MSSATRIALGGLLALLSFVPDVSACAFRRGETVTVAEVVDGAHLRLADGREVRLSGIEAPRPARPASPAWPKADEARAYLSSLVAKGPVAFAAGKTGTDRYGRAVSFLLLADGTSAQARLVEAGLARVMSTRDARTCVGDLLALEGQARARRLGIWADPFYALREAKDVAALENLEGSYQIVEGRIAEVATIHGRVYLNFGDDWRKDFTVTVEPSDVKLFKAGAGAVVDLSALKGRDVRVRGFVERFNGPRMTVTHPEEIELIAAASGPVDGTAKADGKVRER